MRFKLLFLAALTALVALPEAASAQPLESPVYRDGYRYPPPPPPPLPGYYEERRYRERPPEYYREGPPPGYRQGPSPGYREQRRGGVMCAREGQFCEFRGPAIVRYGAAGRFVRRQGVNGLPCNNQVFGDPAVGLTKACYID
jgi:hypothetical protein